MKEYTQWFSEQENSKANETLRPGGARAADDLFGMDGTFRQLSIDWTHHKRLPTLLLN